MKDSDYVRVNPREANRTSFHDTVVVATGNELIDTFGQPEGGDGYKVSTEFVFMNSTTGKVFTLYDWKETNLYDREYGLPVHQFRAMRYDWHVGSSASKAEEEEFARWIADQLA
jgi:hypothetical protein